jgi:hypothetical protein
MKADTSFISSKIDYFCSLNEQKPNIGTKKQFQHKALLLRNIKHDYNQSY